MVVYLRGPEDYRPVAESIAEAREESIVTSLDSISEEPVVYVASPSRITEQDIVRLQKRQNASYGEESFSFITGNSPRDAEQLYFRDHDDRENHCIVNRESAVEFAADEELEVCHEDATVEKLSSLSEEGLDSLGIVTSGWAMHLYLDDGFICGFPRSEDVREYDDRQPYCVDDGEINCPLKGDLLRAEEIDVSHAFLNSCASIIDNNNTGLPIHVGTNLLKTAESVIGGYRVSVSLPHELFLHYSLLRAGYDLTDRVYLLNQNARALSIKSYPYLSFGRPSSRMSTETESRYRVEWQSDGRSVEFTFRDVDTHVIDVTIPASAFDAKPEQVFVWDADGGDTSPPLYYSAFFEGDRLRLLAYSGGKIQRDHLRLRASATPANYETENVITDSVRNAHAYRGLGLLSTKAENHLTNIENHVHNLPELLRDRRFDVGAHRELDDELGGIFDELQRFHRELLPTLGDSTYFFRKYVHDVFINGDYPIDARCNHCDRQLFVEEVVDALRTFRRAIGVCPKCGFVFESPLGDREHAPAFPFVNLERSDEDESMLSLSVGFDNPSDRPAVGVALPTILGVSYDCETEDELVEPRFDEFVLDAGERYEQTFSVDASSLQQNQHHLHSFVVLNGDVYDGITTFTIGDSSGRIPEYLKADG